MERKIRERVKGFRTVDGAGVSLVRVLGHGTTKEFDPILMLDSFDSTNPDDYTAGFPIHPHRGIETITYLAYGSIVHHDNLGNRDRMNDGEVQWMNSGSGIIHEEQVPATERILGVQLWLNLPKAEKMSEPSYHKITKDEIPVIDVDGGQIKVLAGHYGEHKGFQSQHLPMDYYVIELKKDAELVIPENEDASVMAFTLLGSAEIGGELAEEKTAVKLDAGDATRIVAKADDTRILYMRSRALNEPIAWAGPIVMNTQDELRTAFAELENGTFVKSEAKV